VEAFKVTLYLDSPSVDALQMVILSTNYLLISNCLLRLGVRVGLKERLGKG
jgi:hypothetical protein